MGLETRKPGDLITPDEVLDHSRNDNFVITAVGMSGAGKTHYENAIKSGQYNRWDTFSVDGKIQLEQRVKTQITGLVAGALMKLDCPDDVKAQWIAEISHKRVITNVNALIAAVEGCEAIEESDKPILIQGIRNILDPEDLSFLTLWNKHNATEYDRLEDVYTTQGLVPEGKNRYLSTTGSVINLAATTRRRIRESSTVVHFDLDTPEYTDACIAQMSGKPISFNEEHYAAWAQKTGRAEVASWIENHGLKTNAHPDYLPEFVKWRRGKYKELAHVSLKRSEMQGLSGHEFIEMTIDALFEEHIKKLKAAGNATRQDVDRLIELKEEILPNLSQEVPQNYGKGAYTSRFKTAAHRANEQAA